MMKKLSWIPVFLFTMPFIVLSYVLIPFLGRKKAIHIVGRQLTVAAALGAGLIVPQITSKRDFPIFKQKIKRNFLSFGKLHRLSVQNETRDRIEFKFEFCPVTKLLTLFRLPDLCKYSCEGDWKLAEKNKEFWTFSRQQTIGTGGSYCNHTYAKKK